MSVIPCKLCGCETESIGSKSGAIIPRAFHFRRCLKCDFFFIEDPCLDFEKLYNDDYYRGQGADPLVDYYVELNDPRATIRQYEWRGILRVVKELTGTLDGHRWLDYGCGNGGLVRYLRSQSVEAVGYDEGSIVDTARAKGIPILTGEELEREAGAFSIVTLIEVLEHIPDPLSFLRNVRRVLKPGGLLFLTTGNSASHRDRFLDWGYVIPDIHVSFFNPQNLQAALEVCGFRAQFPGYIAGWDDIVRFKVLKTLGFKKPAFWEKVLPWTILSRFVDSRHKPSAHPCGIAV